MSEWNLEENEAEETNGRISTRFDRKPGVSGRITRYSYLGLGVVIEAMVLILMRGDWDLKLVMRWDEGLRFREMRESEGGI